MTKRTRNDRGASPEGRRRRDPFVEESKGKRPQPSHKRPFLSQPTTTRISLSKSRLYFRTSLKRGFHVQVPRAKVPEGKIGGDMNTKVTIEAHELAQARLVHCARCAPSARVMSFPAAKRCRPAKTGFRQTDDRQHGRGNVLWRYCSLSRAGGFLHSLHSVEMTRGGAQAE